MIQYKCDICGSIIDPSKFNRLYIMHIGSVCSNNPAEEPEDWEHLDICTKCYWSLKKFTENEIAIKNLANKVDFRKDISKGENDD